jgi:RNA polymerase sigma factor (sigma-70 family)
LPVATPLERFKALVEPQLEGLYRVARRLAGNRLDAEDLVQETCLSAWQKLPAEADEPHVDRWLLRVLYHRFVDGTRRKRRLPPSSNRGHDLTDDPSFVVRQQARWPFLDDAGKRMLTESALRDRTLSPEERVAPLLTQGHQGSFLDEIVPLYAEATDLLAEVARSSDDLQTRRAALLGAQRQSCFHRLAAREFRRSR